MKNVHLRNPGALLARPLLGCSSSSGAAPGRDAGYLSVDASGGDGTPGVDAAPSADASGDAGEASSPGEAGPGAPPPGQACMTQYLPTLTYLNGFDDPQWYVDNIPFLDVPDALTESSIQPVYYDRWSAQGRGCVGLTEIEAWVTP